MVTAQELRPLRSAAPDFQEAESLKSQFSALQKTRDPFFLTAAEMEAVFRWKLRNQYARGAKLRATNPVTVYESITRACFEIRCENMEYETKVRVTMLTAVPGIGVPVASAVLALADPLRYCVVDFRGWRAVFGEDRRAFTITDYLKYLKKVRQLAQSLDWCVQETDLAIWELDRRRNGGAS